MKYIRVIFVLFLPSLLTPVLADNIIVSGTIIDENKAPIFAASIYLKNDLEIVTQSEFDGTFSLLIPDYIDNDTIVITAIGYKNKEISASILFHQSKELILEKNIYTIDEVIVQSATPISSYYTFSEISKYDIYMNPLAQGDVLTAITALPSSSCVDETSAPSLRGSIGSATIVSLNGVPVHNPAKTNSVNNQGVFGIFNPEIINKEYIYASNPPLTIGNTTAGLVEIETANKFNKEQIQFGVNLSGINLLMSKKIKSNIYMHLFGNILGSSLMKKLESQSFPEVLSFTTQDIGLSLYYKICNHAEFRSYNYYNGDDYKGEYNMYAYADNIVLNTNRYLTINNMKLFFNKGFINVSHGYERFSSNFKFANIDNSETYSSNFLSIYYKTFINDFFPVQTGIEFRDITYNFNDYLPYYYYALTPNSPQIRLCAKSKSVAWEHYVYGSYDFSDKLACALSVRYNVPITDVENFISYQGNLRCKLNSNNSIIFGAGKYHQYKEPSTYHPSFNLVYSTQFSLDYTYQNSGIMLRNSIYYKKNHEDSNDNRVFNYGMKYIYTKGIESSVKYSFWDSFSLFLSNSFIHQRQKTADGRLFVGDYNLSYFLKFSLTYNSPKMGSFSLAFTTRPGVPTTEIISSEYDNDIHRYKPIYGDYNSELYPNYRRLDLSYNNVVKFKNYQLLYYLSLYNILNTYNIQNYIYNPDYSNYSQRLFQKRMFFIGMTIAI